MTYIFNEHVSADGSEIISPIQSFTKPSTAFIYARRWLNRNGFNIIATKFDDITGNTELLAVADRAVERFSILSVQ